MGSQTKLLVVFSNIACGWLLFFLFPSLSLSFSHSLIHSLNYTLIHFFCYFFVFSLSFALLPSLPFSSAFLLASVPRTVCRSLPVLTQCTSSIRHDFQQGCSNHYQRSRWTHQWCQSKLSKWLTPTGANSELSPFWDQLFISHLVNLSFGCQFNSIIYYHLLFCLNLIVYCFSCFLCHFLM